MIWASVVASRVEAASDLISRKF